MRIDWGSITYTRFDVLIARFRIIVLRNLRFVVIFFSVVTIEMYMINVSINMSMTLTRTMRV